MTNNVWFITGAGRGMGLQTSRRRRWPLAIRLLLLAAIRTRWPRPSENPQTCWW